MADKEKITSADPSCDDVKEAYEQGLNDAWELARKLFDMEDSTIADVFYIKDGSISALENAMQFTPREALAKLKAYEDSKIEVGDVVIHEETGMKFLIITYEKDDFYKFGVIDLEKMTLDKIANNTSAFKKTGKHIDIQSILSQIGGE